jgi:CRP-like cAMP-binding protein
VLLLRKDAKIELLKRVPLFAHCNKRQLTAVAQLADLVEVPAGTELMREGEFGREFLIFAEGAGEIRRKGRKIDTVGPGDFVGEMALLTGAPRNASVKTTADSTLLAVTGRAFDGLLDQSPDIQRRVLRALAERLHPQTV